MNTFDSWWYVEKHPLFGGWTISLKSDWIVLLNKKTLIRSCCIAGFLQCTVCVILLCLSVLIHVHRCVYIFVLVHVLYLCLSTSDSFGRLHLTVRSLCTGAVYRFLADAGVMYSNEASSAKIDKWIWVGDHNGNSKKLDTWHFQI